jgi:acyl-ACP thioesterase
VSQIPSFLPEPARGRVFAGTRRVRATDVTPAGRLRLDAVARYLQDVAADDVADTGWQPSYGWLLRRCALTIRDWPGFGETVGLRTFCSAAGPRWTERTTTVARADGVPLLQAAAVWVAVDPVTGQPCPLADEFRRHYGEAAQVYWAAVEDVIAGTGWPPGRAVLEYHRPVLPGPARRNRVARRAG